MGLFDVHAHLTSSRFAGDVDAVIGRAEAAGVTTIVSNGLNIVDNEKVLALSQSQPLVRPALGLYPVDAVLPEMLADGVEYPREDTDVRSATDTVRWLEDHADRAIAIGEIGLDRHWVPEKYWQLQEAVFRQLVAVALGADLPIIIHTRKAEARTLELLLEMKVTRVNWHCFSSRLKLARRIAEAGHFLSVPANARRSETFTGLLQTLPRDQLLLETDCPYLAPEPGERNEPANVAGTCAYAAELWQVSEAVALGQLEDNFERLFRVRP
jgi:TatD DNase family protein